MNTSTEHQYHAEGEETEREASFPQPTVIAEDTLGICIGASSGQRAFFDDAAGLIHIVEGRMVSAVELPRGSIPEAPLQPPPSPAPSPSKPLVSPPADADGASGPHTPRGGSPEASPLLALPPGAPSPGPPVRHMRSLSGVSTASSGSMRSFLVSQGPPITAVRTSLDDSATAVQRSKQQVEFLDHATGNMFVASPE